MFGQLCQIEANAATSGRNAHQAQDILGSIPLFFIKNEGQIDSHVKYYERGSGHITFFTEEGVTISLTHKQSSFLGRYKGSEFLTAPVDRPTSPSNSMTVPAP